MAAGWTPSAQSRGSDRPVRRLPHNTVVAKDEAVDTKVKMRINNIQAPKLMLCNGHKKLCTTLGGNGRKLVEWSDRYSTKEAIESNKASGKLVIVPGVPHSGS